jgi:hypothetical protein
VTAEQSFARQITGVRSNWAAHWGETVFAASAGACWFDLGHAVHTRPHLTLAAQSSEGQARRVVYSAAQLARLSLLEEDVEQAATYALAAVDAATGLKSKRSKQVVRDLHLEFKRRSASCRFRYF